MGQQKWSLKDFLFPNDSKLRLALRIMKKVLCHPIWCIKRIDRDHIQKFIEGLKSGNVTSVGLRMYNYLGGGLEIREKPQLLKVIKYKNAEAVPPLHVPAFPNPLVSIIIPVYNQFHYTYASLCSLVKNSGDVPYEIIVADDGSDDLTTDLEKIVTGITVIHNKENLRFLKNCNHAAQIAKGEYILFLNNDTQVQNNWLQPLVELMEKRQDAGMVGSKLIYSDGRLQEAGGILWKDGSAWNYGHLQDPSMPEYNYVKEVDYISGASIMIRRELWKRLGGFDERFAPAYCEDSDLAFQIRAAGYKVLYQPKSVVVHFEGISNGTDVSNGQKAYQAVNSKKLYEKWKEVLEKEHNSNGVNPFLARDRSLKKKTLLFVDHYVPMFDKDAGSRTVFAYIQMFVRAGYNVKFIGDNFYKNEPYTSILQQMGVEVLYGSRYMKNWKEWLVENASSIDYAFLNRPHIAVKYIDLIREKTHAKILYYGHDLHFLRIRREYEVTGNEKLLSDAEDWKEKELSLMRKSDVTAYPSVIEAEEIRKIDPSVHVIVIPAYIYEESDPVQYTMNGRKDLFFIGGYTHGPNVDAVKWFVSDILPKVQQGIPDIRIHIAGSNMPEDIVKLASDSVIIDGLLSDEQLSEMYHSVRLNVVPLRYGAGIKGKIIESMYNGLPVVTTECGAEGILNSEDILKTAETADEIAQLVIDLYNNEKELVRMSELGKQYVKGHYSESEAVHVMREIFDLSSTEQK